MTERTLIELLYGEGSHLNTLACVEGVPLGIAGSRPDNFPHSIWQLVCHMNYWMAYELKRVHRENPPYPIHALETWPTNAEPSSEEEWQSTVATFRDLRVRYDFALQALCPVFDNSNVPSDASTGFNFNSGARNRLSPLVRVVGAPDHSSSRK